MKVIVAGSRTFNNYNLMKCKLDELFNNVDKHSIEIISGNAYGADKLGEKYAKENNIKLVKFPADWSLGKSAGYVRNKEMRDYVGKSGVLALFWDGESNGSRSMLELANEIDMRVLNVIYKRKSRLK